MTIKVVKPWESPFEEAQLEAEQDYKSEHERVHHPNLDVNESDFGRFVSSQVDRCPCASDDLDLVAILSSN